MTLPRKRAPLGRRSILKREKRKYSADLPKKMYLFFKNFADSGSLGVPSFSKFAVSIGLTLKELDGYRKYKEFEKAWEEAEEIRRDYLIDQALYKRFDPSFVKFLLCEEVSENSTDEKISVVIRVTD
jgi:hypothetical protein